MTQQDARIRALDEAVRRFGEAWARGDVVTLETMLSPGYTHTDASGRLLDRSEWLDYVRQRQGRATEIDFRDVQTRIHGDIAIVTGINDLGGAGVRRASDSAGLTIRFTQLWLFRDGRWLREAFQATTCEERAGFA
jgi:ketosteroid isomerase-like protein